MSKLVELVEAEVLTKHCYYVDEYYGVWVNCPNCDSSDSIATSNYCCNCGCKFIYTEEAKKVLWIRP